MPDEDLLLDRPKSEFGAGIVGVCDICHKRQAVIVLEKERYKLCVMDFLNKSWIRTSEKPTADTFPFSSFTEYVNTPAIPGGVAVSIRIKPTKATKHPLVLIMADPLGITQQNIEAAVRFARAGFEVVMPDFGRIQGPGYAFDAAVGRSTRVFFGNVLLPNWKRHRLFRVMDACRRSALQDGMIDPTKQALFGAGYGGALALAYAAETEGLKAVALAYPYTVSPHGILSSINVPVRAVFGDSDHTTGHSLDVLKQLGKRWSLPVTVAAIQGGGHNFLSRDIRNYDVRAAEDGWKELLVFLKSNLEPPPPPPKTPVAAAPRPPQTATSAVAASSAPPARPPVATPAPPPPSSPAQTRPA